MSVSHDYQIVIDGEVFGEDFEGIITASYSTGKVSGETTVGGLVGLNSSSVAMCYSTGPVTGNEEVGGLIGHDSAFHGGAFVLTFGRTTKSFWDVETSGQAVSAGGTGKDTDEMQTASTFLDAGWDLVDEIENGTEDIWWILEGQDYPRLWWEPSD